MPSQTPVAESRRYRRPVDRYLAAMLLGGAMALSGVGMTAYTLFVTPDEGVNIGGGLVALLGLVLIAVGGALRSE